MGLWLAAIPWRNFAQKTSAFLFCCFLITANCFASQRLPDFLLEKKAFPQTWPRNQGLDVHSALSIENTMKSWAEEMIMKEIGVVEGRVRKAGT